jgi:hypothetical protein
LELAASGGRGYPRDRGAQRASAGGITPPEFADMVIDQFLYGFAAPTPQATKKSAIRQGV